MAKKTEKTNAARLLDKEVMICKTGMPVNDPDNAKEMLSYLLEQAQTMDYCREIEFNSLYLCR